MDSLTLTFELYCFRTGHSVLRCVCSSFALDRSTDEAFNTPLPEMLYNVKPQRHKNSRCGSSIVIQISIVAFRQNFVGKAWKCQDTFSNKILLRRQPGLLGNKGRATAHFLESGPEQQQLYPTFVKIKIRYSQKDKFDSIYFRE